MYMVQELLIKKTVSFSFFDILCELFWRLTCEKKVEKNTFENVAGYIYNIQTHDHQWNIYNAIAKKLNKNHNK